MAQSEFSLRRFWLAVAGLVLLAGAYGVERAHYRACLRGLNSHSSKSSGTIHVVVVDPSSPLHKYPAFPPLCWGLMLAAAACLQAAAWSTRKEGGPTHGRTIAWGIPGLLAFALAGVVYLVHFTWVNELIHMTTKPAVFPPWPMYFWGDLSTGELGVSTPPPSWILLIAGTLCVQNAVRSWWGNRGVVERTGEAGGACPGENQRPAGWTVMKTAAGVLVLIVAMCIFYAVYHHMIISHTREYRESLFSYLQTGILPGFGLLQC